MTNTMMAAECMFDDEAAMRLAMPAFVEAGSECAPIANRHDEAGTPTVWLLVWARTMTSMEGFFDAVEAIAEPLGGTVLEAGPTTDAEVKEWLVGKVNV